VSTGTAERADAVSRLVRETVGRVDAIAPDAMRAVLPFLKRARDELQAELQTILEGADPDERFTTYQRTLALRGLEATFDRIAELDPAMAKALGIGRSETGQLAVSALDDEVRRLSAIFGDGVPHLPQLDQAAIIAKGDRLLWKRHTQSAGRYAGAIGDDIKAQFAIREGRDVLTARAAHAQARSERASCGRVVTARRRERDLGRDVPPLAALGRSGDPHREHARVQHAARSRDRSARG
jgi:hypothetical protein